MRTKMTALIAVLMLIATTPAWAADRTEQGSHDLAERLILSAEGFDSASLDGLRDLGFGFGDAFRISVYTSAFGGSVEDFLAAAAVDPDTGEYDFAWGEFKKTLTDEQQAALDAFPRNFGQLVSDAKRNHGRDEHQPERANERGRHNKREGGDENS